MKFEDIKINNTYVYDGQICYAKEYLETQNHDYIVLQFNDNTCRFVHNASLYLECLKPASEKLLAKLL